MEGDALFEAVDRHRDPRIWERGDQGWELLDSVASTRFAPGVDKVRQEKIEECEFRVTPSRDPAANEEEYVLLAKGFVG